jgi:hypothetical protein
MAKYICEFCGDTFTRKTVLDAHVEKCEDNPDNGGDPAETLNPSNDTDIEEEEEEMEFPPAKGSPAQIEKQIKALQEQKEALEKKKELEKEAKYKEERAMLDENGMVYPPKDYKNYREISLQNLGFVLKAIADQDALGYDVVRDFTAPLGHVYLIFKKRKVI